MDDENEALPSDAESGALKPKPEKKTEPSPPEDGKAEKDPSEQPS